MAATITPKATTLEQQTFETLYALRNAQVAYETANPDAELALDVVPDIDSTNNLATFTVTLPLTQSDDADGGISFDATEVLPAAAP